MACFRERIEKLKEILRQPLPLYYIAAIIGMAAMYFFFNERIGEYTKKLQAVLFFAEAALFASPLFLLRGRFRVLVPVFVWILALFFFANGLYNAYNGDLLPFGLIFDSRSYNDAVAGAVTGLLRPADLVYLIVPLALSALYARMHIGTIPPPRTPANADKHAVDVRSGVAVFLTSLCFCVLGVAGTAYSGYRYHKQVDKRGDTYLEVLKSKVGPQMSRFLAWSNNGLLLYLANEVYAASLNSSIDLTDEQTEYIRQGLVRDEYPCDSVFAANRDKNLVFIVVESLNSWCVGDDYLGFSVTPVLDSLMMAEGTVSAMNVNVQISNGQSSDGQLMYNTGLLPLKGIATVMIYGDNDFGSLVKRLRPARAMEFIGEIRSLWNHASTTVAYGYDRLVDNISGNEEMTQDESIFAVALDSIRNMPQPFVAEITTMSSHFPFEDPATPELECLAAVDSLDPMRRNYLESIHNFDTCLGRFIDGLESAGLVDNTVIVIASDHDHATTREEFADNNRKRSPIPVLFVNTGHTATVDRPVGQIDVFPTVLQIMGVRDGWRGLGSSMLQPSDTIAGDPATLSDMIIRGDYRLSDNTD